MKSLPFIVAAALTFAGCARSDQPSVETLAAAYAETAVLAARYQQADSSYSPARYQEDLRALLAQHRMTPESFKAALDTLARQPERFRSFTALVEERAAARK